MTTSTAPENNCAPVGRLCADTICPAQLHQAIACAADQEHINTPPSTAWNCFFLEGQDVTEDCMNARATQEQSPRDHF